MENSVLFYTLVGISAIALAFALGFFVSFLIGKKSLSGARRLASTIVEDSKREAEQHRRLELTKAREEWLKSITSAKRNT